MASPPASRIATAPSEQQLLPDEIMEGIFLLLESGRDLARASATCRSFRRVATCRRFLRRFTSLHPPPVVGFIDYRETRGIAIRRLDPAVPPHRSAPAARALLQAGDFTFSFLPGASYHTNSWCLCDVRDGRFLLSREATDGSRFVELVVCDPLYRRYVQIPPIPADVVPRTPSSGHMKSEPFFAPAEQEELGVDSQFRVIYNWLSNYKVVTFVFSAATEKWCYATSFSFLPARLILEPIKLKRYYARSCFYWVDRDGKYMLVLDLGEMKFSLVEVLHGNYNPRSKQGVAIMDAVEDRVGLFTLDRLTLDLYTKTCQNNGAEAEEWRHDEVIHLPELYYNYCIIGAAEGYLLLGGVLRSEVGMGRGSRKMQCFALNLETLLVETLCLLNDDFHRGQPYASFPPPLSPPSL